MPYRVGSKGSYGCSGYPAVKVGTNEVMGCHKTRSAAAGQIYAINRSEGNIGKNMHEIKEGDFVMGATTEGMVHGMVEHIMWEGGTLGTPGTRYALESMPPENPAMSVRIYKEEDEGWEPTAYSIGMMYTDAEKIDIENHEMDAEETMTENDDIDMDKNHGSYESDNEEEDKWDNLNKACWDGYEQRGMKEKDGRMVPNCVPVSKAENPNYDQMIKPRRGGSEPSNARLYAQIIREAKDKFDVYPSAVANAWVVQEYKRRGGKYKTEKREFSTASRERMAEAGTAMPDGSFPIANRADLMNAIRSVGRAKNYDAAKKHIINRARELNAIDMLPEDWKPGVRKTMWGGSVFDLNPFVK